MAEVRVIPAEVELVPREITPGRVHLELSMQEAWHLRDVLGDAVCGPATTSNGTLWSQQGLYQALCSVLTKRDTSAFTRLQRTSAPAYLKEL